MDIYDFLNDFNNNYDSANGLGKADAPSKEGVTGPQLQGSSDEKSQSVPAKPAGYPKTRAEAEALGYKPLTDTAPDIQPCDFGYPCNDCGYCH